MKITQRNEKHELSWYLTAPDDGSQDVQLTESRWDSRTGSYVKTIATIRPDQLRVELHAGFVYRVTVTGRKLIKGGAVGTRRDVVGWQTRDGFIKNAPVWLVDHMSGQPRWVR